MVAGGCAWDTMRYRDMINERAVCILLECILVVIKVTIFNDICEQSNYTKLATLAIKAYIGKSKINLAKTVTSRLNVGPLVIHSDTYLTMPIPYKTETFTPSEITFKDFG